MWFYETIKREEFEKKKDLVETIMLELGAEIFYMKVPYDQKTTTFLGNHKETHYSTRPIFTYKSQYFRVDEVLFGEKPFLVLECGTLEQLLNNTMEDGDPFPYDLSDDEIRNEVQYSLGIEPYPNQ